MDKACSMFKPSSVVVQGLLFTYQSPQLTAAWGRNICMELVINLLLRGWGANKLDIKPLYDIPLHWTYDIKYAHSADMLYWVVCLKIFVVKFMWFIYSYTVELLHRHTRNDIDGLVQGWSNSIADALVLLGSCINPPIWFFQCQWSNL